MVEENRLTVLVVSRGCSPLKRQVAGTPFKFHCRKWNWGGVMNHTEKERNQEKSNELGALKRIGT